jgi:hypothetical protein
MVRDFTKSAISLSWALSLLGLRQTLNLLRPGQQRVSDSLSSVTQATIGQLDGSVQGIYRIGDNLQARVVDIAFASFNPINWVNPAQWAATGPSHQQPANGTRAGGQQAPYSGEWAPPPSPVGAPYSSHRPQGGGQPSLQSLQEGGGISSALIWFNPLNWFNPDRWTCGRSGGSRGCEQKTCGCEQGVAAVDQGPGLMGQMSRPPGNPSADASSSPGTAPWGPMPCRNQSAM